MIVTTILTVSLLSSVAVAQYGAPPPNPATTSAAAVPSAPPDTPGHMNIDVGFNGGFTFHPANITAPNGTLVTFWIPNPGFGHSVTQSLFNAPCTFMAGNSSSPGGFDSGLQTAKQFTINITDDTKPIWFHCKQVGHCGMGMVGSINAPTSGNNTFETFQAAAIAIGSSETTETDNGPANGGAVGAFAVGPPTDSTGTSPSGSLRLQASLGAILLTVATIVTLA